MEKITCTRQELYDMVWETPLSIIAKKYMISNTGLKKKCKEMNIPVPKMGYWQKIRHGYKVNREKLPEDYSGDNSVKLTEKELKTYKNSRNADLKKLIKEIEAKQELPLKIPSKLTNPDNLIVQLIHIFLLLTWL